MKTGEIYKSEILGHNFVFLSSISDCEFSACMITHSGGYSENILMSSGHFKVANTEGNQYDVQFEESYLTCRNLVKLDDYGPFKLVGELTEEGIQFVESNISNLPLESFTTTKDKYCKV